MICGNWPSLTVTVKEVVAVRPAASVTLQFTVVVPLLKVEPAGGVQTTAFGGSGQLSLAAGSA
jgi:hypothetical protein